MPETDKYFVELLSGPQYGRERTYQSMHFFIAVHSEMFPAVDF
jgi:hypothetical protein